jgi:hypothetical protein
LHERKRRIRKGEKRNLLLFMVSNFSSVRFHHCSVSEKAFRSPNEVFYFFALQVFIPKGAYNGQKLIKLVSKKTTARIIKTRPKVPEMTLVK